MSVQLRAAATALLLLVSGAASAEVRTFHVTATVIESEDPSAPLGTQLQATFRYDDRTPNTSTLKIYSHFDVDAYSDAGYFSGSFAAHNVDTDHFHVDVWNNWDGADIVEFNGFPAMLDDEVMPDGIFYIHLQTAPGHHDAIKNAKSLPTSYDMADWSPSLSFGELRRDGGQLGGIVRFSIDSIEDDCVDKNGKPAKKHCQPN